MAANADLVFDIIGRDRASQAFDQVGDAAERAGGQLEDVGQAAERGSDQAAGAFSGMGGRLAAGAAVAGALAGAALIAAFTGAMERPTLSATLDAQLGATAQESARWGAAAGDLYAQAYGDSFEQVNASISGVIRNIGGMRDASEADLERVAGKVSNLGEIFDQDVGQVSRAVGKMIKTGLAKDADEALDLLTRSFQSGANEADDLLDTVSEYSTQFRQLGLSGSQAMGLISQGLKAGARDSDTVADALKEFAIRAIDGSKTSSAAYKALGLDAQAMTAQIARGGQDAATGLDTVLDRLRGMKDPVAQQAAAVGLFGTKAEDLADALWAIDPSGAVGALGEVAGAADKAGDALQNSAGKKAERFQRAFSTALDGVMAKAVDLWDKLAGTPELQETWDEISEAMRPVVDELMPQLKSSWEALVNAFSDNKEEIAVFAQVIGGTLLLAFDGLLNVMRIVIMTFGFVSNAAKMMTLGAIKAFDELLSGAASAFGWIPGIGPKLAKASAEFSTFAAKASGSLASIPDRDVDIRLNLYKTTKVIDEGFGHRATGGPVTAGQPYIVGERRAELFVPGVSGTILPSVPKPFMPQTGPAAGRTAAGGATLALDPRSSGSGLEKLFLSWLLGALRASNLQLVPAR